MAKQIPTEIQLHQKSRMLEIAFGDGRRFELSCEFLRVHSPSAEVAGHGPGQGVLQIGKEDVGINTIEQVGNYAVQLVFDDNHDTGIYSWEYLYELCIHQEQKWQKYLERLEASGYQRKTLGE